MQIVKDAIQSVLSFSSDVVVILVLVALGSAYAFLRGKRKAVSLILSFYPAVVIFRYLPFFKQYLANNQISAPEVLTQVVIFLVILIPIHLVLNRLIATEFSFSGIKKIIELLAFGVATSILAVFFSYQIVNMRSVYNFGGGIDILFSGNLLFLWVVLPL